MPTKAERVAERNFHFALLGLVEGKIEPGVQLIIIGKVIDGGRYDRFADG